ncbi:hypothetical protein CYJ99_11145 [Neisseria perflava]|mgnify:CR=1 FL=1|uniref:Uncharacterized protein n=1 Tax=Neisseria perflava TaxID=33053 RepID=A0A9X7I2T9_NEIPE|nr:MULTISPECIES: hypothetical protein [Neisseria]PLA48730.1 hypothetical protein CYJ99_11145 [Neisseria perflava]WOS98340.1 hypothetical protein CYJ98_001420 [Neisseria perflava]
MKQRTKGLLIIVACIISILIIGLYYNKPLTKTYSMEVYSYTKEAATVMLGEADDRVIMDALPYNGGGAVVCCVSIKVGKPVPVTLTILREEPDKWEHINMEVPIEYVGDSEAYIQAHILPGHKVRVFVTGYSRMHPKHPMNAYYEHILAKQDTYEK